MFLILISLSLYSCFASGKIAIYIQEQAPSLSETNIDALSSINIQDLRKADDSLDGALYYAGLLWYLNDNTRNAEIAWKRSARTGQSPWKDESLRLVGYYLTRESKFNQIAPFIQEIASTKEILADPEVFTYYARALWSDKDYNTLSQLLEVHPTFQRTLRNRISINQAYFNYDMWKTLLAIQNEPKNTEEYLANLLSSHSIKYNNSELPVYLSNIPSLSTTQNLSEDVQSLLKIRSQDVSSQEIYTALFNLDDRFFQKIMITLDLLDQVSTMSNKYKKAVLKKFATASNKSSKNIPKGILFLAQAEILYTQGKYKQSTTLYQQSFEILKNYDYEKNKLHISDTLYLAQWRYLYNIISTDTKNFYSEFLRIVDETQYPLYYANLLEEYLSFLLRKNNLKLIEKDYTRFANTFKDSSLQLELVRWESILSRINPSEYKVDFKKIFKYPKYSSDIPFDYLMNYPNTLSADIFIKDWTQKDLTPIESDANSMVQGYLKYNMIRYGYGVALENAKKLNNSTITQLSHELYAIGSVTQSLTLIRIASSYSKYIIKDKKSLMLLYPIPYLDILEQVTNSPIEKALMMGLMREESSFDYDIKSYANAIGLMQLLYPTAVDIAKRIHYNKKIRLTDPSVNITLGYNYVNYLIKVLKSPLKAIASYNGGLGNVWKWEKKYDPSNLILFADSLPYKETRNYVRKVSSSAMIYGMLYFGITPEEFQKYLLSKI